MTRERSLLCCVPNCGRAWTSNFGRPYCAEHNPGLAGHQPTKRQTSLPAMGTLRQAVRPYAEPVEREGDAA